MKFNGSRDQIQPFLEYIPDASLQWNPCENPGRFHDSDIQVYLSCMARDNAMYVVANVGDMQPCDRRNDSNCPKDSRYQYNTDVVYNPQGVFLAKYHKYNLFYEYQFDTPVNYDIVTFDTEFGRFGVFTCFDILFKYPPVELVQDYNISNIVFPTAWMDAGPFLTSIQFHSSFAIAHGVNFLAANIHRPAERFHGSGVYTPTGPAAYYYNITDDSTGELTVATIPQRHTITRVPTTASPQPVAETGDVSFTSRMFKDIHNIVPLTEPFGDATVCHNSLCCNVTYNSPVDDEGNSNRSQVPTPDQDFYALAAYSGLHNNSRYYMEICSLVRCKVNTGQYICGETWKNQEQAVLQPVENFVLYGNFSTTYVYPQILLGSGDSLALGTYPREWTYLNGSLTSDTPLADDLGVASLFGRHYYRDLPMSP